MKSKFYLCILMWIALLPVAYGQHTITSAPDVIDAGNFREVYKTAAVGNHIYVAEPTSSFLRNYDGTTVSHHTYPTVGGSATDLYDFWIHEPLATLDSDLYMTLQNGSGNKYLYRFNGSSFVSVALPFPAVSNPVTHKGKVFVMARSATAIKLISYNGTSATTVLTYPVPSTAIAFQLISAGPYLYMLYNANDIEMKQIVRVNGGSALALPLMSSLEIKDIIAMPGTQNIIIDPGLYHTLKYFDGTTLSTVTGIDTDGTITSILPFQGAFYIQYNYEETMPRALYRYQAGVTTYIPLPAGATPEYLGESTIYHNAMYIPAVFPDLSRGIYKFDGTNFTVFFNFPGLVGEALSTWAWTGKRNGNLLIIPDTRSGDTAYEFDGTSFSWIHTAAGEKITRFIGDSGCYYGWLTEVETGLFESTYRVAKEFAPGCSPVFPVRFDPIEVIDITAYAPDRDWCWTGIDVDWTLAPCPMDPLFCPESPQFRLNAFQNGNVVYQDVFDQPFDVSIPLADDVARRMTMAINTGNGFHNVLQLNKALVSSGFESISLHLIPGQRDFTISAQTDNDMSIPFIVYLLNADGDIIWQQGLTAPLSNQALTGTVSEPGVALRIVPVPASLTSLQDYGITAVTHYPNPTAGKMAIDIQSDEELEVPVTATLTDMTGTKLVGKTFKEKGVQQFDVTAQKPGLYILTITAGNAIQKDLIQVK